MKKQVFKSQNSKFNAFQKVAIDQEQQMKLKGGDGEELPLPQPACVIVEDHIES